MHSRLLGWFVALALITGSAAATVQGAALTQATPAANQEARSQWNYPIGRRGRPFGDGFWVRHGFAVENTWFNPGYWHTGEDWYALKGDTAGANVYAVSDGTVVYAGANYPGRVVIVEHAEALFSMYGHLDPRLAVKVGQRVAAGEQLGTVLKRGDKIPNHLHFELRTFLTTRIVNGSRPRYGFRCGRNCPPGPGYWPIRAPELPTALGWLNPTHVIAGKAAGTAQSRRATAIGHVVVATEPVNATVTVRQAPATNAAAVRGKRRLQLQAGQKFPVLAVHVGATAPSGTSAEAYEVWYKLQVAPGNAGWVQAAVPGTQETGRDGRGSSVRFNFLPAAGQP